MSSLLARGYDSFLSSAETDQESNAVLTELDKGLRSSKVGDQCEAIVRCPKLFDKFPFPILINSLFLKLAEVFRLGSNLLRLWVLRVCQQSEKHLDKILNIEEFVRRIYTVINCNDPVGRALTLRILGAVAAVIPEKQQVHHAIRDCLDSRDTVEVEAAIHASVRFAAQSKTFAISMCSKMASMIESLQIPINMKLQVIPVLRYMHHDANTAALVKTLCTELLPKYPAENFVLVILDSLTHLSLATLVDIPDQVTLLLGYLQDPRRRIRYSILRSMLSLARKGAHLWPKGAMQSLIAKAMACNDQGDEQSLVLSVVRTITECPVTCNALLADDQHLLLELCSTCLLLEHHTAASQAVRILTGIVSYCQAEKILAPPAYMTQIDLHLESLIYASLNSERNHRELRSYLVSGVQLAEKNAEFGERFVQLMGGILADDFVYPTKNTILITETLGALCSQFLKRKFRATATRRSSAATSSHAVASSASSSSTPMDIDAPQPTNTASSHHHSSSRSNSASTPADPFAPLLPQLLRRLDSLLESPHHHVDVRQIETLAAVCLQAQLGRVMPQRAIDTFERLQRRTNFWTQYRVARSASRYGHHYLAARIYTRISARVSAEHLHFYLVSLAHIAKAECVLIFGYEFAQLETDYGRAMQVTTAGTAAAPGDAPLSLSERLEKAAALYCKAGAALRASATLENPLQFHAEFVRLRGQLLEALHGIVVIKNTRNITPPPAIAHTLALNSRDYLQKFGHVTNQLRKMVKTVKQCEDAYGRLYKSVFDADPCTLDYLEISKSVCIILGHSVETICFASPSDLPSFPTDSHFPETTYLIGTCQKMKAELATLPVPEPGVQKSITAKHTDTLVRQIETLLRSPLCMPRFYFQVLQNTKIKLSVAPAARTTGDPVVVNPGSALVVKVEGVVQHSGIRPNAFRTIESVQLTLTSQLLAGKQPVPVPDYKSSLASGGDTVQLTQTVRPHRDFLSGSFLVPLNNGAAAAAAAAQAAAAAGFSGAVVPGAGAGASGGHWQVTLEVFVVDENSVLWNTGLKSSLLVRVPEDVNKSTIPAVAPRRY